MLKRFGLFIVLIISWGQIVSAQDNSAPVTDKAIFKLTNMAAARVLQLDQLQGLFPQGYDHQTTPGYVTVMVKIENGDKISATWMPFHPHAGIDSFYHQVQEIIDTWEFTGNQVAANGEIYYTVSTNGTINIDLKSLSLPNYDQYAFPEQIFELVAAQGFETRNIRAIMKKAQMPGNPDKGWIEKLTVPYAVAFLLIGLAFILFGWFTWSRLRSKVDFPDASTQGLVRDLWVSNSLKIGDNQRSINIYNPDLNDEIAFIENEIVGNLEKIQAENQTRFGDHHPLTPADYQEIRDKLKSILKNPSQEAIRSCQAVVWEEYSARFIQKAIDLCCDATNKDRRISRVFQAGLDNHLFNKTSWYASSEIDRAIDKTAGCELEQMKGYLDGLWFISSVSPMVGLFGTVTGISKAFAEISQTTGGLEQAELITRLASGINEALYTTIVGLILGMAATIVYYLFKTLVDRKSSQWEEQFVEIANNF